MAYTFDPIFAADPSNPDNVASNGVVTIFAPGDSTRTPLTLTTIAGLPLPNPVMVSENGFSEAFRHETLDRVAWEAGGFTGYLTSYEGLKSEAVSARSAAENAAENAAAAAEAKLAQRVAAGEFQGEPGKDGSNVIPTAEAIANAKKFNGKNGQTFIRLDPAGEATQTIMELSPPSDKTRVKIDFWSAPEGVAGRMRTMSIESHGTNDPYNPTNNHNTIYTTDNNGNFQHVFDWEWGPTYDALLHIPTLKITAHQDGSFDKNVGVGTRFPIASVADGRVVHINSPVAGKTAELKQTSGTVESRVITYSSKTFIGTYTAHDTVLIAGGEANANLTLKPDGRSGFSKSLGIGTTAPAPATAGRLAVHLTDATGVEYRAVSGTVSLRMAAVAGGAAQFGADSAHDLTLYAGGLGNGQVRMGATGGLGFFNKTPVAKPTGVAVTAAGIHTALVNLGLIGA